MLKGLKERAFSPADSAGYSGYLQYPGAYRSAGLEETLHTVGKWDTNKMATVSKKNTDTSSFEALFNRRGQIDREIEEERAEERRKVDAERVAERRKIEEQKEAERQRVQAEQQRIEAERTIERAQTLADVLEQIAHYDFSLADLGLEDTPAKKRA